jgi:phage terminase large subunit-like protein
MRMHAQSAAIENGFVHIPETAPGLAQYLHELAVFPTNSRKNSRCSDGV